MNREIKFRAWDSKLKKMFVPIQLDAYGTIVVDVRHEDDNGQGTHPEEYPNPYELMQFTGLKDKNGKEIYEGDIVSLDGNMTADNSLGFLPNGWIFEEHDKYAVKWDDKLAGWVLDMPTKYDPEDAEIVKYLNHARSLLIDKRIEIVGNIYESKHLLT